jgi:uncharacterized protein YjdB
MSWSATGRRSPGVRGLARLLTVAAATVAVTGCEFLTGVPGVDRVRVTVGNAVIAAQGAGTPVSGEAYDDDGGLINHRRRIVNFRSSNPSVATVSGAGTGTVLGISAGTAWIIGESGGKKDSAQIEVRPPQPAAIQFNPAFPTVRVNATQAVQVIALGVSGQPLPTFTLACQSSNTAIFTVSGSGTTCVVQGRALGRATLQVTVNGAATATVEVTVSSEPYSSLTASIRSPIRESERVPLTVRLFQGTTEIPSAGRALSFLSSDQTVATVDNAGVVTAVGPGTATITVTGENDVRNTTTVQVTRIPVRDIFVAPNPIFRVGLQTGLQFAALDSLGRSVNLAGRSVVFEPTTPGIVSISSSGVVAATAVGTTTVRLTIDGVSQTFTARVTPVPAGLLRIDSAQVQRAVGSTFQYTATVLDSLGRAITDRVVPISWFSNNPLAVSIDATTGLARALAPGGVTITARVDQTDILGRTLEANAAFLAVPAAPSARAGLRASP